MGLGAFIMLMRDRISDLFTPSVSSIISGIRKLEAKLEKSISIEAAQLGNLRSMRDSIDAQIMTQNRNLDAAYKLLDRVSKVLD